MSAITSVGGGWRSLALLLGLATLLGGCLGDTYRVSRDELTRLARLHPAERGRSVRVLQRWGLDPEPPAAEVVDLPADARASVLALPDPPTLELVRTLLRTHQGRRIAFTRAGGGGGGSSSGGGGGGSSGGGGGGGGGGDGIDGAAVALIAAVVVATGALVLLGTLAATEGSRYDGWVAMDPFTSIFLMGPQGPWVTPLALLTPEQVAASDYGIIVRQPTWAELGRAPLDRQGAAFRVDLGAGGTFQEGSLEAPWWPAVRIAAGGYPIHELGLLGVLGFQFGAADGILLNARYAFEIDTYPLAYEVANFGLYAQVGDNHLIQETELGTVQQHSLLWGGGLGIELEVTARMAISFRGGAVVTHLPEGMAVTGEALIGAAIY